ncbi:MAG: glycosyltransferase [Phycisphaeraceae bacterium]|nr:glycosyltransferase [Phycisphaeraceae bacterium]
MSVLSIPSPAAAEIKGRLRPTDADGAPPTTELLPRIDVVVAFWNESKLIAPKVRNLLALDYPPELLRFIFVDGGSTDESMLVAKLSAKGDKRFAWLSCPGRGKTAQLNMAMDHATAPWLLVTDADARLPTETLRSMIGAADRSEKIGLVGVRCYPRHAIGADRAHWSLWNTIRKVENVFGCATALGPCYLIRRAAFGGWPKSVIADDVFASLEINRTGARAILSDVLVIERRAPSGLLALVWHKLRKARAVVREFLRFLPRSLEFGWKSCPIFLFRAIALLLGPFAILTMIGWLAITFPFATLAGAGAFIVLAGPAGRRAQVVQKAARAPLLMVMLSIVLVVAIATCAFVRSKPEFCRWKQEEM